MTATLSVGSAPSPPLTSHRASRGPWVTALAVLGVWLLLALIETTKEWVGWQSRGTPRPWGAVAVVNVPFWLYWAAATPIVVALARRFPLEGARRWRSGLVHLVAAVAAAVGHSALVAGIAVWVLGPAGLLRDPSFGAQFRALSESYLLLEIVVYWMILGVVRAAQLQRRYAEARLAEAHAAASAARSEARVAEARLHALRMEVDPHFLFNALNAVSGLVRTGDSRGATDMLARIADLLRVTLRYGREGSVSLRRELELVREYLAIEAVRLGDRLQVDIAADPEALDAAVPPLILQPLVENAIRHGVAAVPGPARLAVRAGVEGESLWIEVTDSGPGPAPGAAQGTGLRNVTARLEAEFDGAGSFELASLPGGGGRARLAFPFARLGGGLPS